MSKNQSKNAFLFYYQLIMFVFYVISKMFLLHFELIFANIMIFLKIQFKLSAYTNLRLEVDFDTIAK